MHFNYISYVILSVGLTIIIAGALLRFYKNIRPLFGTDTTQAKVLASLKRWEGNRILLIGFVLSGLGFFFNDSDKEFKWVFVFFIIILVYNTIVGSKRLLKQ